MRINANKESYANITLKVNICFLFWVSATWDTRSKSDWHKETGQLYRVFVYNVAGVSEVETLVQQLHYYNIQQWIYNDVNTAKNKGNKCCDM